MKKRDCKCIMKANIIIYAIIFENNKVYIGQTTRGLHKVVSEHDSKKVKGEDKPVYNAMRELKYVYMVLECTSGELLSERVVYWSDIFNSMAPYGYNLRINGEQIRISDELRNRKRGLKNGNTKTIEHYSKNAVTKIYFKNVCRIKGWKYENFIVVEDTNKHHQEKKYFFTLK
ncbi:MAG: hypothetical protein ACRC4T_15530 [Cetobacterium sp.]